MGGKYFGDGTVVQSAGLINSMLKYGLSANVGLQFWQNYRAGTFAAFDYGSKEANLRVYGREKPLNYKENYNLIDIPVHLFVSLDDRLIRADDSVNHYNELKKLNPRLARLKVFKGFGHCDFNYGRHEALTLELQQTLKRCMTYPTSLSELMKQNQLMTVSEHS